MIKNVRISLIKTDAYYYFLLFVVAELAIACLKDSGDDEDDSDEDIKNYDSVDDTDVHHEQVDVAGDNFFEDF